MTAENGHIAAVVFDMGGVLVELGPISSLLDVQHLGDEALWELWLSSSAVRDFEMGRCSVDEFGERLVADLDLDGTAAEVIDRFRSWPRGLYPGAADLVSALGRRGLEIGLLTNTNALHWSSQADSGQIRALFPRAFLSFELGLVKPDAEVFEHVVAELAVPAASVLFLDDNMVNVEAGRRVGLLAEHVRGVAGATEALAAHGLLHDGS